MTYCILLFIVSIFLLINFYKKNLYLSCLAIFSFWIYFLGSVFLNMPLFGNVCVIQGVKAFLDFKAFLIVALELAFIWVFLNLYCKRFKLESIRFPSRILVKKIFVVAIGCHICYSIACYLYWRFYLQVPMFGWLIGDTWSKYRAFSNDFWNNGNIIFHLATYRTILEGFGIIYLAAAFVFLKNLRYQILSVAVFLFSFFMVLHKSFIAELLYLSGSIFFMNCCINYKKGHLKKIKKHVLIFGSMALIGLFVGNIQRSKVAVGSASLIIRYKANALGDLFVLCAKHSFFECKHWDNVFHTFRKLVNLKTEGKSLGRQLYIDIYGFQKAQRDRFPTWWPTPVSGFIYIFGYLGIFIGSFFMATILFFLEYIFRKTNSLFFFCVGFFVLKIYTGWIFNWFLISGLIPLCSVYFICKLQKNKAT